MRTTTIRVDAETHATLLELAAETGESLIDTTRAAAEALRRQRFAQHVTEELHALRADPEAWAEYLADAERSSVSDGVA
jgi:hypothetical protein